MNAKTALILIAMGSALCAGPAAFAKSGGASSAHGNGSPPNSPPTMPPASAGDRGGGHAEAAPNAPRPAAPAAREFAGSMHEINQTAFAERRELIDSVDMRLKSSHDALKHIQADAKAARTDARADFKAALADVKAREKDVQGALKASRNADEASWEARRAALAQAYEAHADAIARLEVVAHAPRS